MVEYNIYLSFCYIFYLFRVVYQNLKIIVIGNILLFKRALAKYTRYLASIYSKDKLFFCRMDLLFRNELINDRYLKDECTKVFNLKSYLIHIILLFISIKNLLKVKIGGLKTVHYMIDIKNSNGDYDFRSKEILDILSLIKR